MELVKTPKIISVVNQKGGVGKTTTAINLATALAANGQNILLIDMDPQANASTGLAIEMSHREKGTYEVLFGNTNIREAAQKTSIPNLSILPATVHLAGAEIELVDMDLREFKLREAIKGHYMNYDYVFIDCPPSLNLLTLNALVASHSVIVPLQCEFYAMEGLSLLLKTIERVRQTFNPSLEIEGVILTMFDGRNNLSSLVSDDVRRFLGAKVYQTVIPRNVRISEAPSHGLPVLVYDHRSRGAQAYIALAREMLKQQPRKAAA